MLFRSPALQAGADSEAGSGDIAPMEQDLESEGESDDFSRKVASCLGRPVEVLMGDVVFDPKGDPAASKPANGEETSPEAGKQKVDFIPPLAPKKGANDLPADGNDTLGAAIEKEHEERMANMQELLTTLPPDASLADMEKRRVLLEEQAAKVTEREQIGRAHV